MPFIDGKFYMNPAVGRMLERNRKRAIITNVARGQAQPESALEKRDSGAHWVTIEGRHILIDESAGGPRMDQPANDMEKASCDRSV